MVRGAAVRITLRRLRNNPPRGYWKKGIKGLWLDNFFYGNSGLN